MADFNVFKFVMIVAYLKINNGYEKPCNVSTSTIEVVTQCPSTEREFTQGAQRKNCAAIPNTCPSIEYHCVRNWNSTALYEVCAPSIFIIGSFCSEYNEGFMSIRATTISCANFTQSCPDRYNSTEQFKYPECFDIKSTSTTASPSSTILHVTQLSTEHEEKDPDAERNSTTGIIVAVVIGFLVIICGIFSVICIQRKMKKENKTAKEVIFSICPWSQTRDVSSTKEEEIPMIKISNRQRHTEQAISNRESGTQQAISNGESGTQQAISNGESGTQQAISNFDSTENQAATRQDISDRQTDAHEAFTNTQIIAQQESGQINILPESSDKFTVPPFMHQEDINRVTNTPLECQDRPLDTKGESQDKHTATQEKSDLQKKKLPVLGKTTKIEEDIGRKAMSAKAISIETGIPNTISSLGDEITESMDTERPITCNSLVDEIDAGSGKVPFDEDATTTDPAIEQSNHVNSPECKQLLQEVNAKEKELVILQENIDSKEREANEVKSEYNECKREIQKLNREKDELRNQISKLLWRIIKKNDKLSP